MEENKTLESISDRFESDDDLHAADLNLMLDEINNILDTIGLIKTELTEILGEWLWKKKRQLVNYWKS